MKPSVLTVMTQLNREKIDLRHIAHQLGNNQTVILV